MNNEIFKYNKTIDTIYTNKSKSEMLHSFYL